MRREVGQKGELIAARYLKKLGYRVLHCNVRLAGCEIDLVARQGKEIVFVEVKTRQSTTAGFPEDSVTPQKIHHIERAAHAWLQENGEQPWRVDVVAVTFGENGEDIKHFVGI
ncbi:TPA: YraN family protein [Candidatus Uhrbacteria bacterium]|nr:YraN family protein [Candidatus Uhrbacteria bacterium]